jgi:aspartyl aminopeptidase
MVACRGGHTTSAYEQNTQQTPGNGRNVSLHAGHRYAYTQASVGIVARLASPQCGHVIVASVTTGRMGPG